MFKKYKYGTIDQAIKASEISERINELTRQELLQMLGEMDKRKRKEWLIAIAASVAILLAFVWLMNSLHG